MKREDNPKYSSFGKTVRLRFGRPLFEKLLEHLAADRTNEQLAFALFSQSKTSDGTLLIVRDLFLPDRDDLAEQGPGCVAPTKPFQDTVYLIAHQRGLGILDIHTHPHQEVPRFSGIDQRESARNGRSVAKSLAPPATHAMVVFGGSLNGHDAVIFDRVLEQYRTINEIEVLGRGFEHRQTGKAEQVRELDPRYHRQTLIPGWNQQAMAQQRIVIVGAGGNGARLFETLVSIGAGSEGWIAIVDPDVIEPSNLPRIPYAFPEHAGIPKVTVAAQHAGRKCPTTPCYPFPCGVTEPCVMDRLRTATVIFGAADNDGVRKFCNEVAVRHMTPYIDLGCDIQREDGRVEAGGQVRVVLPGVNACLVCCGGYDPAEAAIDLLDDQRVAVRAARGYAPGGTGTPSIATLNSMTAQFAIHGLLGLLESNLFGKADYFWFDLLSGETTTARSNRREDCPLCGGEGVLGMGEELPITVPLAKPEFTALESAAAEV